MLLLTYQVLVIAAVLQLTAFVNGCSVSATTSGNRYFSEGHPGMVDIHSGESVTVQCRDASSQQPTIRFNDSQKAVVTYGKHRLELTQEIFKAGFYSCVCQNSVSEPLALLGKHW